MSKQTAVEWLIKNHFGGIENCTPDFRNKINQAKEMEKEQIISAYNKSIPFKFGKQYYEETFKSE